MPLSKTDASPDNRDLAHVPVQLLLPVSDQQTVRVGIAKPLGVPYVAHKLILDAYNSTLTNGRVGIPPSRTSFETLLRKLAVLRKPDWRSESDPVFWLLRVWRNIRQATLSLADVQSYECALRAYTPQEWDASEPLSAKAMAFRAYRCWDRNPRLDQICIELLDEGVLPSPSYTVPDFATGHRILWLAQARGRTREQAWAAYRNAGILPDWRKEIWSR